jgi:hypothetical protein
MAKTAAERKRAQRARDRARLGDEEYKRVEAEKMRKYRASKRPPKPPQPPPPPPPPPPQPQPQPVQPVQPIPQSKPSKNKKAQQQLTRQPQQVIKDYVPLYKKQNATPLTDNSIKTYISQFKKVYEYFTKKKDFPDKLKDELIKILQLKNMIISM